MPFRDDDDNEDFLPMDEGVSATIRVGNGPEHPLGSAEAQEAMEELVRDHLRYEREPDAPLDDMAWEKIETPAIIKSLSITGARNGATMTVKIEVPRSKLHALGNLDDEKGFQMRWLNPRDDTMPADGRLVGESVDLVSGTWTKQGDPSGPKRVTLTIRLAASEWKRSGGWLGRLIADDTPGDATSLGMLTLEPNQQRLNLTERAR